MFSPAAAELERGWPGRIDGDVVVQLAAQTLQSFFSSGSSAREHAEFALADVVLRAPVLEPPSLRIFEDESAFAFANPAAIRSPGTLIPRPAGRLDALARVAAIVGADGELAAWTGLLEWRAPELPAGSGARPESCGTRTDARCNWPDSSFTTSSMQSVKRSWPPPPPLAASAWC